MFILLVTVIMALGGLLLVDLWGGITIDSLPHLPIAAAVLVALVVIYFATHASAHSERRRWWFVPLASLIALAAVSYDYAFGHSPAALSSLFASVHSDAGTDPFKPNAPASVRIRRSVDGSFRAHADINGVALTMLVDTGAAAVVLRGSDADNVGIETKDLAYDTPLKTANGTTFVAAARLKSLRIGQVTAADVEALVAKPGTLNESLLGMSFLRRLESYEVAGDFVTLRQ